MTDLVDVEAFAGPGGWSEGRWLAGARNRALGFDIDPAACRTAVAAGHVRVRADVSKVPLKHLAGLVDGVMLSPPCTTFSNAGHGAGRKLTALLAAAMTRTMRGENVIAWARREAAKILRPLAMKNGQLRKATRAERSAWVRRQAVTSVLVVEPARWVRDIRPRWVALEQVPAVLPLWKHFASLLREAGYQAWAGKLDAECYGVTDADQRYGDRAGTKSIRVTVQEAAVLQSFPADYPWQGNKSEQYRQVGDAIPPLLAARILEQLVLRTGEGEAVA